MGFPEILISILSYDRMSEYENNAHDQEKENSCNTCDSLKKPESNVWFVVRSKVNLSRKTPEILMRLSGDMIEVHDVPNSVQH